MSRVAIVLCVVLFVSVPNSISARSSHDFWNKVSQIPIPQTDATPNSISARRDSDSIWDKVARTTIKSTDALPIVTKTAKPVALLNMIKETWNKSISNLQRIINAGLKSTEDKSTKLVTRINETLGFLINDIAKQQETVEEKVSKIVEKLNGADSNCRLLTNDPASAAANFTAETVKCFSDKEKSAYEYLKELDGIYKNAEASLPSLREKADNCTANYNEYSTFDSTICANALQSEVLLASVSIAVSKIEPSLMFDNELRSLKQNFDACFDAGAAIFQNTTSEHLAAVQKCVDTPPKDQSIVSSNYTDIIKQYF